MAVAPVVNQVKVPSFILLDSNSLISGMGDYVFGFGYSNEGVGRQVAKVVFRRGVGDKVGLIHAFDEWSDIVARAFTEKLTELGGEIVVKEQVSLDESDFRIIVNKLRTRGVTAVYFPLYKGSLLSFISSR